MPFAFPLIVTCGRVELPETARRVLRFVPAAVLLSLAAPSLLYVDGTSSSPRGHERTEAPASPREDRCAPRE